MLIVILLILWWLLLIALLDLNICLLLRLRRKTLWLLHLLWLVYVLIWKRYATVNWWTDFFRRISKVVTLNRLFQKKRLHILGVRLTTCCIIVLTIWLSLSWITCIYSWIIVIAAWLSLRWITKRRLIFTEILWAVSKLAILLVILWLYWLWLGLTCFNSNFINNSINFCTPINLKLFDRFQHLK